MFAILICSPLFGQAIYEHNLDEEKLSELKESIRHLSRKPERWTYDTDKEYNEAVWKYERDKGSDKNNKSGDESAYESPELKQKDSDIDFPDFSLPRLNLGPVGKVILYIVLGGILAALIYFLFISSDFKRNGKKYESIELEDLSPAEIPRTELERLLEEALNQKNYRKAVRIYYLFILKDLSEREWIEWEKQKTNMHYVIEMNGKNEAPAFSKVVTYFEFIWYGKRDISENQFRSIQPNFTELLSTLNIK